MARKRLSRKELVQKDEITTTLETTTAFLLEHKRLMFMLVGAIVLCLLLLVGWNVYAANREATSQDALSKAIATFNDVDQFDSDEKRFETALAEAQAVREQYPSLPVAKIAEYYIALNHEALGNPTASMRILQSIVDEGEGTTQQVARYALAESYKTRGDLERAIEILKELLEAGGYATGAVLFELGSLHEALSETEEASNYFQLLVGDYPDSPFLQDAEGALERLKANESALEEAGP